MLKFFTPIFGLCLSVNIFAGDDWLGVDNSPHYLSLEYSAQPSFGDSYGMQADFELFVQSRLFLSYGRSTAEDATSYDTSEDYSIGFSTDPYADWSFGFRINHRGKHSDVEIKDMSLDLSFYVSKRTSMTIGAHSGKVNIQPYQLSFDQAQNFQNSGVGDIDKTGLSLGIAYDATDWSLSVGFESFSYEDDISGQYRDAVTREADGRELLYLLTAYAYFQSECESRGVIESELENCIRQGFADNETQIRSGLSQARDDFFSAHFAKDQKSVLAEHQMYAQYVLVTNVATFELGGGLYESYIDGERWSFGNVRSSIPLSSSWDMSLSAGYSEESASSWYGLGVGVSF